jgi:hypothetical protein
LIRRFSPASIPGLVAWYDATVPGSLFQDAAMTTPATADTNPVGAWRDLSGNGNHATQPVSGSRPALKAGVVNGGDAVRFTAASTQYLSADALASVFSGTDRPFTAFFVFKLTDVATFYTFAAAGRASSNTPVVSMRTTNNPLYQLLRQDDAAAGAQPASGVPNTSAHLIAYVFNGTSVSVEVDGAVVFTAAADVGTITLDTYTLGAWRRTAVVNPLNGDLQRHALYSRVLSPAEIARITAVWG